MSRFAIFAFLVLWTISMFAYPGWNAFYPDSSRHDFWRNFLCDLFSAETPDHRANLVGSIAMGTGVLILVGGCLLPLWWQLPVAQPWRTVCRSLGAIAALLTILICVEQAFALPVSHNVITLAAASAGLIPTSFVALVDWRASDATTLQKTFLVGTLAASLTNFVSYAIVQAGGTLTVTVPAAQKVALICLLIWLFLKSQSDRKLQGSTHIKPSAS